MQYIGDDGEVLEERLRDETPPPEGAEPVPTPVAPANGSMASTPATAPLQSSADTSPGKS